MLHSKITGIVAVSLLVISSALATEPLYDQLAFGEKTGPIFEQGVGWLPLPNSEQLQILRRQGQCSAIGGPRGIYKYEADRLWITGLYKCGGPVALEQAYPEMRAPSLAVWVSGKVVAKLGKIVCRKSSGVWVFESELTLEVERGVVKALSETRNDASACP